MRGGRFVDSRGYTIVRIGEQLPRLRARIEFGHESVRVAELSAEIQSRFAAVVAQRCKSLWCRKSDFLAGGSGYRS